MRKIGLVFFLLAAMSGLSYAQGTAPAVSIAGSIGVTGGQSLTGQTNVSMTDANYTLAANEWWAGTLKVTSSVSLTTTRNIIAPANNGQPYCVENQTTGGQSIQIIASTGTGVTIPNSSTAMTCVRFDGTNYVPTGSANGITALTGDVTAMGPGSAAASVVKVNGGSIPASAAYAATNSSSQIVAATTPVTTLNTLNGTLNIAAGPGISVTPSGSNITVANTGAGNPGACTVSTPTQACVQLAPFNAYIAPVTAITATFAIGTSGSVASCANFPAGSEVWIPGAATSGIYVGSVASCSGTTLTLNSSTSVSVGAQAAVVAAGTTATATFAVGTSGAVSSCSTFVAGQGVQIPGAGDAAAIYNGTVVSCSGTTLTVTPATGTSVASGTFIQHDESAAIQAAITSVSNNGGGAVYLSDGYYLVNGPLQDTSGANGIIVMPVLPYGSAGNNQVSSVTISGFSVPFGNFNGTHILTNITSGNVISGYDAASTTFGPFTNVLLVLNNLSIVGPADANINLVNAGHIVMFQTNHLFLGETTTGLPTTTTANALITPRLSSNVRNILEDVHVVSMYNGITFGEHDRVGAVYAENMVNPFIFDSGGSGAHLSNSISVDYMWCQGCKNEISGGSTLTPIAIQIADLEAPVAGGVYINDPSNKLYGYVNYNFPTGGGCITSAEISGAIHLTLNNVQCSTVYVNPLGNNVGLGYPLNNITSGVSNFFANNANNTSALVTSGADNIAIGSGALAACTTCQHSGALGTGALQHTVGGNGNYAWGYQACNFCTTGGTNVAIGYQALNALTTGASNTVVGSFGAGASMTGAETGDVAIGTNADIGTGLNSTAEIGNGKCTVSGAICYLGHSFLDSSGNLLLAAAKTATIPSLSTSNALPKNSSAGLLSDSLLVDSGSALSYNSLQFLSSANAATFASVTANSASLPTYYFSPSGSPSGQLELTGAHTFDLGNGTLGDTTGILNLGAVVSGTVSSSTSLTVAGGTAMTANQGNGTSVQHSTGSTTTNDCAKFDANGNTVDAGVGCGSTGMPLYLQGGTIQTSPHMVWGGTELTAGIGSIGFSGSAAFTGSGTYACTATDNTSASPVQLVQTNGTTVAVTGTGTDSITVICVGN